MTTGNRDHRLPESDDELRDWLVLAWEHGWRSRAHAVGRPMGDVIVRKKAEQTAFLRGWDLQPKPDPPPDPRSAGRILSEAYGDDK